MGDPKKLRKKYEMPTHPWQKDRIEEEKALIKEYGLKNKKEIWRMQTILKKFKDQVKALASRDDEQAELEREQLVNKLVSLGLVQPDEPLDTVLGLGITAILDRRIQTILVKRSMARSHKQARQFITHGHVIVNNKKITYPNYMVSLKEQALIEFIPASSLSDPEHPERVPKEVSKEKLEKRKEQKKEEAPPAFEASEIEQIEEKGAVEKKAEEAEKESADVDQAEDKSEKKQEEKQPEGASKTDENKKKEDEKPEDKKDEGSK